MERAVVVDLGITVEQPGGVQQERDVQRVRRFVLGHAACPCSPRSGSRSASASAARCSALKSAVPGSAANAVPLRALDSSNPARNRSSTAVARA